MLGAENQQSGVIWVALAQEDGEARRLLRADRDELELHEAALPARVAASKPDPTLKRTPCPPGRSGGRGPGRQAECRQG